MGNCETMASFFFACARMRRCSSRICVMSSTKLLDWWLVVVLSFCL